MTSDPRPWFEVQACADGIVRLRESGLGPRHAANIWLVLGRDAALVIDAGVGVAPLRPVVEAITSRPVICLITHGHYDHIGGAWEFADRRAHRLEAAVLERPTPVNTMWRGWLTEEAFRFHPYEGFSMADYGIRPAPPTSLVDEGETIDLGERRLTILHVPGHAPGLLAVCEPRTGILFTSDALYDGPMFFDLPGSDHRDAARSIRRLRDLAPETIHPGHGDSFDRARLDRLASETLAMLEQK